MNLINKLWNKLDKDRKILLYVNIVALPMVLYAFIAGIIFSLESIKVGFVSGVLTLYIIISMFMISSLIYGVYFIYRATTIKDKKIKKNKIWNNIYLTSASLLIFFFVLFSCSFPILAFFF